MGALQPAAALDAGATHGDSVLAAGASGAADPLELSISPKRALVSLAFLGAVFARRYRTDDDRDTVDLSAPSDRTW